MLYKWRKAIRLWNLAALVLALSLCGQEQRRPNGVDVLSAYIRKGQYSAAVQDADIILQSSPKDPPVLTLKAIALSKLGRASEAASAFQKALLVDPRYVPALAGLAQIEYTSGSRNAKSDLDRLLQIRPDDQVAHAMRGVLAWQEKDCSAAVEHFAKAPDQIATQSLALHEYGACLVRAKRFETAVQVFAQLHRLKPEDRQSLYALASVQLMNKDYKGALDTLQSLDREAKEAKALELAATAYEASGDTPNAVRTLREAMMLDPDRPELYLEFSSISLDHKSYQVGIDMINAGLSRLPRSAKLYLARGVLFAQMGQYEKADRDFSTAALLDPKEALASSAQALTEIQADRLDDALKTVESRIRQNPRDPFLPYLLAEILTKNGAQPQSADFSRALAAAQRAVALKPDFVLARDVLSRLYLDSGQIAAAIMQCRLALAADPNDQVALYRLIRALKEEDANRHREEISQLVRRLTAAREEARRREEQTSQYKLVESSDATVSKN